MSTNSFIAIQEPKRGAIISTYVHWDGNPEGVGQTLMKHYADQESAMEVCKLGYISALYATIEQTKDESAHSEKYKFHYTYESFESQYLETEKNRWAGIEYVYLFVCKENDTRYEWDSAERTGYWLMKQVGHSRIHRLNGRRECTGIHSLHPLEMEVDVTKRNNNYHGELKINWRTI